MSLLRIRCNLREASLECAWVLLEGGHEAARGESGLAQLPRGARRVQLIVPASQVLLARAQLPQAARRRAGAVLAFAVEDITLADPESSQANWLGRDGDGDMLAVIDKPGLKRWLNALESAGFAGCEVIGEAMLLPREPEAWSLAWDGNEGFLRTGEFEGGATDCGDRVTPPLSIRLALDAAAARDVRPSSLAVYALNANAGPDLAEWQRELGVTCRNGGAFDWRTATPAANVGVIYQHKVWRVSPEVVRRLRPAAWLAGIAILIHLSALVADWAHLASERRALRQQMEARFRAALPDTVAVVDPALQMRRKLAEARHAVGKGDNGDFLPMIGNIALAANELPAGSVRVAAYDNGRFTLELAALEAAAIRRLVARLQDAGLRVESSSATSAGGAAPVITVWSS
ncbi:MAG: ral secretion pathway protein GspL [Betaproteobacteria bacterium]|nr:ral secretion pathway protein GspL [Betaproteobacteria bacterium]